MFLLTLEREERRKREKRNIDVREKHCSVASCTHADWESNPQSFGAGTMSQPPEPGSLHFGHML